MLHSCYRIPKPGCLWSYAEMLIQLARRKFYTVGPSHGPEWVFLQVRSGPFQKAGGREVAFTDEYRNNPSEPVQNRFKIQMVRKNGKKSSRFANVPFHSHMNRKGRFSSGPPASFPRVHASAFHLLSPSILEKLTFPAEMPVFLLLFFRHKLLNFNLSEPPNTFLKLYYLCFFSKFL